MIINNNNYAKYVALDSAGMFVSSSNLNKTADSLYSAATVSVVDDLVCFANHVSYHSVRLTLKAWILESEGRFSKGSNLADLYAEAMSRGFPQIPYPYVHALDLLNECESADRRSWNDGPTLSEEEIDYIRSVLWMCLKTLKAKIVRKLDS